MSEPLTDAEMAEYVREHRCYNARRDVTLADWDRGIRAIETLRRDPKVDWDAIEGLVYLAERRGDITIGRAAEILGLMLRTWTDRRHDIKEHPFVVELAALSEPRENRPEPIDETGQDGDEEQTIRDWLAGMTRESGAPLPPSERRSQPIPRRQVTAVVATLLDLLDEARAANVRQPVDDTENYMAAYRTEPGETTDE